MSTTDALPIAYVVRKDGQKLPLYSALLAQSAEARGRTVVWLPFVDDARAVKAAWEQGEASMSSPQEGNMSTTDAPINTFAVSSQTTGECHIPDVFHDFLTAGLAALDFARVWSARGGATGRHMTVQELEAAAVQFEALARRCRRFSEEAAKAAERTSPADTHDYSDSWEQH